MSRSKAEPSGSILPLPLQFLAVWLAVWLQRILQVQIDYLKAENRALKEKLGGMKVQLSDPGRPRKREKIADLVLRMAKENETWGYTRIKGALQNLGYEIGRNTIKRIMQEHGIEPAPIRGKRMPWAKFIKAHLGAIVGMDFLTVEVATLFGLVRYHVLFVIDIGSRAVEIAGITRTVHGCSRWLAT